MNRRNGIHWATWGRPPLRGLRLPRPIEDGLLSLKRCGCSRADIYLGAVRTSLKVGGERNGIAELAVRGPEHHSRFAKSDAYIRGRHPLPISCLPLLYLLATRSMIVTSTWLSPATRSAAIGA